MIFSRREVLGLGLASATGLLLPRRGMAAPEPAPPPPRTTLSIVQGATDDSKTQFSVVHAQGLNYTFAVLSPTTEKKEPDTVGTYKFAGQLTEVSQAFFSGLTPGTDYTLQVLREDKVIDQRIFQTLDPNKTSLKFAICSCMHDGYHQAQIWKDLAQQNPDLIFFIGDSTYANDYSRYANPEMLWRRFSEARHTLEIYHLPRLIPIFAVWDDHDYGMQNGTSDVYPYTKESTQNFQTFFPQNPDYCRFIDHGPGLSSCLSFRGQQILLMDDRSFRLKAGSTDRFAHWGQDQENWALQKFDEAKSTAWIVNGSQFFPAFRFQESVARDHARQLEGFLAELKKSRTRALFASGDVHYSELTRVPSTHLGYETLEVTASSVHSPGIPPWIVPNGNRLASTGKRNYTLVQAEGSRYEVFCFSQGQVLEFQKAISL